MFKSYLLFTNTLHTYNGRITLKQQQVK